MNERGIERREEARAFEIAAHDARDLGRRLLIARVGAQEVRDRDRDRLDDALGQIDLKRRVRGCGERRQRQSRECEERAATAIRSDRLHLFPRLMHSVCPPSRAVEGDRRFVPHGVFLGRQIVGRADVHRANSRIRGGAEVGIAERDLDRAIVAAMRRFRLRSGTPCTRRTARRDRARRRDTFQHFHICERLEGVDLAHRHRRLRARALVRLCGRPMRGVLAAFCSGCFSARVDGLERSCRCRILPSASRAWVWRAAGAHREARLRRLRLGEFGRAACRPARAPASVPRARAAAVRRSRRRRGSGIGGIGSRLGSGGGSRPFPAAAMFVTSATVEVDGHDVGRQRDRRGEDTATRPAPPRAP